MMSRDELLHWIVVNKIFEYFDGDGLDAWHSLLADAALGAAVMRALVSEFGRGRAIDSQLVLGLADVIPCEAYAVGHIIRNIAAVLYTKREAGSD